MQLDEVLPDVDLAVGTFRHATSQVIPELTRAALTEYHPEEAKEKRSINKKRFLYNLSRTEYEREWGKNYHQPGLFTKALGFVVRWFPKIGPLKALAIKPPTPEMEDMYFKSMNKSVGDYQKLLREAGEGTLQLTNNNCDTGRPVRLGEYALCDATHARLVEELFKRGFARVPPDVRASLLAFYDSPPPPMRTKKAWKAWRRTASEVGVLRSAPGSADEEALRQRLFHPPRGLESPKAKGEHT